MWVTSSGMIAGSARRPIDPRLPDETFVYQFSSGSTGRPKRVARTHGQCWAEAESLRRAISARRPRSSARSRCSTRTGMGCCLVAAVRTRRDARVPGRIRTRSCSRRARALELLERERVTVFPGVPFHFRHLADAPEQRGPLVAAAVLLGRHRAAARRVRRVRAPLRHPVRQLYGCTEAGTLTANLDPDPVATVRLGRERRPGAVTRARRGRTRSSWSQPGDDARLRRRRRSSTARAFRDGWFLTGDLGRLDAAGRLYVTGRKKLLIEVAGHKVDPIEVEDVLAAHPKVREAVVVGVPDGKGGEEIVKAVIVPADHPQERELIEFCQQRLANFKVPQVVEFRDEIPRSPLGKVLRKYLV